MKVWFPSNSGEWRPPQSTQASSTPCGLAVGGARHVHSNNTAQQHLETNHLTQTKQNSPIRNFGWFSDQGKQLKLIKKTITTKYQFLSSGYLSRAQPPSWACTQVNTGTRIAIVFMCPNLPGNTLDDRQGVEGGTDGLTREEGGGQGATTPPTMEITVLFPN